MLNLALLNSNEILLRTINESFNSLSRSVVNLLENQSLVIRGKSLLTVVLLLRHFPLQWFTILVDNKKFLTLIDRLTKDSYKYVQYGLMHFIEQVNATIPIIMQVIEEDLVYAIRVGNIRDLEVDQIVDQVMDRRKDFKNLKGHMTLISLLLAAVTSQLLKSRIINEQFLEVLSRLYNVCEPNMFSGADEFTNAVLAIVESICSNQKTLFNNSIPIIQHTLPALMNKLRSDSNDVKFLSLKVFTDITIQYIGDDSIFDPSKIDLSIEEARNVTTGKESMTKHTTDIINEMLVDTLLPSYKHLLNEEDPVPLFALKLLAHLTERSDHFVTAIESLGLFPIITEYYAFGHKRLNQHTIKVVKSLIDSPEITLDTLYGYYVIENTLNIIDNMLTQHQMCYCEAILEILQSLVEKVATHCELLESIESDPYLEKSIEGLVTSAFS